MALGSNFCSVEMGGGLADGVEIGQIGAPRGDRLVPETK